MTLTLTVHRGTKAIGGSCIEVAGPTGERVILDVGRPLDAPRETTGLLPSTLDLERLYARQGRDDFISEMATSPFATSRARLIKERAIIMLRDSMVRDFDRVGLGFTPADAYALATGRPSWRAALPTI